MLPGGRRTPPFFWGLREEGEREPKCTRFSCLDLQSGKPKPGGRLAEGGYGLRVSQSLAADISTGLPIPWIIEGPETCYIFEALTMSLVQLTVQELCVGIRWLSLDHGNPGLQPRHAHQELQYL
jgi:hypothetical protein